MENYDGRESMSDRIEEFEKEREREKTTEGSARQENDGAEMN